jgi:CRISPR-associated protein Cas2
MPSRQRLHVIAYDISSDRTRTRVAEALEDFAVRVQDSVFEAMAHPSTLSRRLHSISLLLDEGDSLRCYPLSPINVRAVKVFGRGSGPENGEFMIL